MDHLIRDWKNNGVRIVLGTFGIALPFRMECSSGVRCAAFVSSFSCVGGLLDRGP